MQSDIFAVGVIFYEMLTGSIPTWENGAVVAHRQFKVLPFDLQDLITRMIARKSKNCYRSFDRVIPLIDQLLDL